MLQSFGGYWLYLLRRPIKSYNKYKEKDNSKYDNKEQKKNYYNSNRVNYYDVDY